MKVDKIVDEFAKAKEVTINCFGGEIDFLIGKNKRTLGEVKDYIGLGRRPYFGDVVSQTSIAKGV